MMDSQNSKQIKTIHQTLQLPVHKVLNKLSPPKKYPVRVMYAHGKQFRYEA